MEVTPQYMLDTCVVSNIIKSNIREGADCPLYPELARQVDTIVLQQDLFISAVSMYELERGAQILENRQHQFRKLAATRMMMRSLHTVGLDTPEWRGWRVAASIYATGLCRKPSIAIGEQDLLILATAVSHRYVLLTTDKKLAKRAEELGYGTSVKLVELA